MGICVLESRDRMNVFRLSFALLNILWPSTGSAECVAARAKQGDHICALAEPVLLWTTVNVSMVDVS